MEKFSSMMLLRIFVGENDKIDGEIIYEKLLEEALKRGLKGATVLRGMLGFGVNKEIHSYHLLSVSENLPVVIEIVDIKEKIELFLPVIDNLLEEGLVTVENIKAFSYSK